MRTIGRRAVAVIAAWAPLFGAAVAHADNQRTDYAGKTIRYEVAGDSHTAENIVFETNNGQQLATDVTLPWSDEFTADHGLRTVMLRAQNDGPGSTICRIMVDGKQRARATSNGGHANITCAG